MSSRSAAPAGISETCLRFAGAADIVSAKLPALFVLDPTSPGIDVGREVATGGLNLDSAVQELMISRSHAKLTCTHGRWKVEDLGSTNGTLLNGVKVQEALLQHGDVVTFGGGVSTDVCHRPGPKATRSIYTYSFDQPNDTRDAGQEGTLITCATPAAAAGAVSDQKNVAWAQGCKSPPPSKERPCNKKNVAWAQGCESPPPSRARLHKKARALSIGTAAPDIGQAMEKPTQAAAGKPKKSKAQREVEALKFYNPGVKTAVVRDSIVYIPTTHALPRMSVGVENTSSGRGKGKAEGGTERGRRRSTRGRGEDEKDGKRFASRRDGVWDGGKEVGGQRSGDGASAGCGSKRKARNSSTPKLATKAQDTRAQQTRGK